MKNVPAKSFKPDPLLIAVIVILGIWTLFWKGLALWRSSQNKQRNWFIALFILSTFINELGIIEIIYLFWFAEKRLTFKEIKSWFLRK